MSPPVSVSVRIATFRDADDEPLRVQGASILDAAERERVAKFRHAPSARAFEVSHGVARHLLSEKAPLILPSDWRYETEQWGKPRVAAGLPSVSFNLSHTHGAAAVVATTASVAVGIDIEQVARASDLPRLAQRCFVERERQALPDDVTGNAYREVFFDLWTLKEAFMKATGRGFSLGLERFGFDLREDPMAFWTQVDGAGPWSFFTWTPVPGYRVSLCVQAATIRLDVADAQGSALPTRRRHRYGEWSLED